ncbi:hypothetical protein C365_01679 [Cryptococcus neoformans Bt85]|nr:hypothetical protein C365_01679 [Cryptococcus neoformans var. grubii Bt85]
MTPAVVADIPESDPTHAQAFLADKENLIKLNTEMTEKGFKMLGTMVGPKKAREEFLKGKMQNEAKKIARLKDLPSKHVLLLLRFCIQQNLRHLQRSLKSDDLKEYWEKMDQELWDEVQRMRTRQTEGSEDRGIRGREHARKEAEPSPSPFRRSRTPLIHRSAQADKHLSNIFGLDLPDEAPIPSQRELCASMGAHQQTTILEGLDDPARKRLIENASKQSAPFAVSTLHSAMTSSADPETPGLNDVTTQSTESSTVGLQSVEGAVVSAEPRTLEGQRRNDLRVRGRCGLHTTDYDLKVYCLNDRDARSTLSAKPASTAVANHVLNRYLSWLDKVSENATKKAPATHSGMFKAVVMSTRGIVSRETVDEMRRWRKEMGPAIFEGMMRKISLELVRARARTFAM